MRHAAKTRLDKGRSLGHAAAYFRYVGPVSECDDVQTAIRNAMELTATPDDFAWFQVGGRTPARVPG
jgi:hypothetical protein